MRRWLPGRYMPANVIRLGHIQLRKNALIRWKNMLGPILALCALSEEAEQGAGRRSSTGVQIVRGVKSIAG